MSRLTMLTPDKMNPKQLELYGLAMMILEPAHEIIKTGVWYVDYEETPRELALYEGPFTADSTYSIIKRHGITNRDKEFKMASEVISSITSTVKPQ